MNLQSGRGAGEEVEGDGKAGVESTVQEVENYLEQASRPSLKHDTCVYFYLCPGSGSADHVLQPAVAEVDSAEQYYSGDVEQAKMRTCILLDRPVTRRLALVQFMSLPASVKSRVCVLYFLKLVSLAQHLIIYPSVSVLVMMAMTRMMILLLFHRHSIMF